MDTWAHQIFVRELSPLRKWSAKVAYAVITSSTSGLDHTFQSKCRPKEELAELRALAKIYISAIQIYISWHVFCKILHHPQLPSFHPSRHLSLTLEQSNSGFPSFLFTLLCSSQNHWDKSCWLVVTGSWVFKLGGKNPNKHFNYFTWVHFR